MDPDLTTIPQPDADTGEVLALVLAMLPELADTVGGMVRLRTLPKHERIAARKLLRRVFAWEQEPVLHTPEPCADTPGAESDPALQSAEVDPTDSEVALFEGVEAVTTAPDVAQVIEDQPDPSTAVAEVAGGTTVVDEHTTEPQPDPAQASEGAEPGGGEPRGRDLAEGLALARALDAIASAPQQRKALWARQVFTRLDKMWPITVNCCNPDNWDITFAMEMCDRMARERLARVQGVLDTIQVDLGYKTGAEDTREAKIRRALSQQRANLPLVEG